MQYQNKDFFQVLGHISVFFATLDFFVSELILRLVPTHTESQPSFSDRTTLGQKLNILEKMTTENVSDPDILADVHKALPEAQEMSRERNRYIHDLWIFRPDDISQGRIGRAKMVVGQNGGLSFPKTELTLEELYGFLRHIGELQKQFGGFVKRFQ